MEGLHNQYDAIIVGAGPAGSVAARRLAQAGLKVLVAEQRRQIGEPVQCAEFVPRRIESYVNVRPVDIAQPVNGIRTFIAGEIAQSLKAPGYVLRRNMWDSGLAAAAAAAGADIRTGIRVIGVNRNHVILRKGTVLKAVRGRFILGCDGAQSVVGRHLGNGAQEHCVAMQREMALCRPLTDAGIYFDPGIYGGYAWLFPKGMVANVGMAVHPSQGSKLRGTLEAFCQQLVNDNMIRNSAGRIVGGIVPAGGMVSCLGKENILVAGDASGCVHPITGAGVMNAVISGRLAATAVLQNLQQVGATAGSYQQAMEAEFGRQFSWARQRLLWRDREWATAGDTFSILIRRSWIAFPEYYRPWQKAEQGGSNNGREREPAGKSRLGADQPGRRHGIGAETGQLLS
ncbi:MAG TPA: NAD(P)/FAD-dependent oxidoreductase [Patescibacteria group bacterium]|nr:NAD(P)/FAD-dependent oxidoreductase [Patescibacteria group bacterium]